MKSFIFPLQAVLVLRQRQERVALENYGRALRARTVAGAAVRRAQEDFDAAWQRFRLELEGACYAARAAFHRAQCTALEERVWRTRAEAEAADRAVGQTLAVFTEARREREAVDRLRERRHAAFEREAARRESRVLDDLAGRGTRALWAEAAGQDS